MNAITEALEPYACDPDTDEKQWATPDGRFSYLGIFPVAYRGAIVLAIERAVAEHRVRATWHTEGVKRDLAGVELAPGETIDDLMPEPPFKYARDPHNTTNVRPLVHAMIEPEAKEGT